MTNLKIVRTENIGHTKLFFVQKRDDPESKSPDCDICGHISEEGAAMVPLENQFVFVCKTCAERIVKIYEAVSRN